MSDWRAPEALFDGGTLHRGLAFRLEDGHVAEIAEAAAHPGALPLAGIVSPGFVDLQVNGGGGVLLNATPTAEAMDEIAAAHRRFGTVAVLPTLITDTPEVQGRAVEAALAAKGRRGVIGLHIEGPHLDPARRGTHAARFLRPFAPETLAHVRRLRDADIPVMITVAPAAASTQDIAALAATGAVVSIGHADCTAEEAHAAFAAGAGAVTHLFNAMAPILNRAPGLAGAALNSSATCGIICDGIHVADDVVALAIRSRPGGLFVVSDAMPTIGGPDSFTLYGNEIHLENGRLINAEGSLAGAHVTMAMSAARLTGILGFPAETALQMAVSIPATLIGRPGLAGVSGRPVEDLLHLAPDLSSHQAL